MRNQNDLRKYLVFSLKKKMLTYIDKNMYKTKTDNKKTSLQNKL